MSVATPEQLRHELLEPYLQRLRAYLRARGDEDRPLAIPCEPEPLELSAEERATAWSVLCGETVPWSDAGAWIALGAALFLAVAAALEGVAGADERSANERLSAVRAVAASYTEALRETIAAMLTGGESDDAKRLSSFRNKLLGMLTALRTAGTHAKPATASEAGDEPAPAPSAGDKPVPPEPAAAPDPELTPYLRRAAAFLRARGHEDRPLTVGFGRRSLSLSTWERRVLWQVLCEGRAPASEWHRLIPASAALQLALLPLLDELDRAGSDPGGEGALRGTLDEVVRIAGGVVEGFRTEIQRAVTAAALDDAKQLSALSNTFGTTLIEAKRALARAAENAPAHDGAGPGATAPAPDQPATEAGAGSGGPPEALAPFLDRAQHLLAVHGHDDRPVSIAVGNRSWNLDTWERQVLWKVWCEEGPPPPEWSIVLGYGAAAHLAVLVALERLRRAGEAPAARAAAETERDTALALATELAERLRATAETVAADGQTRLAERLGRFQAKVTEPIQLLKQAR